MRRFIGAALVLMLVGGAWWLQQHGERGDTSRESARTALPEVHPAADTPLAAPSLVEGAAPAQAELRTEGSRSPAARDRTEPQRPGGEFPRSRLAGRVVHADGSPAGDVEVSAECHGPFASELAPLGSARSRADGSFSFIALSAGPFRVEAVAGHVRVALEDVTGGCDDLELVLDESATLRGRVIDDAGHPVSEFWIGCAPASDDVHDDEETWHASVRGTDGAFAIEGLPSGDWRLVARVLGDEREGEALVHAPTDRPLDVVVRETVVRGVVLDARGAPLTGAWVSARTHSGDGGCFELHVSPGIATPILATVEGNGQSDTSVVTLAPGEVRDGVVLRMQDLARLTGELIGLDGRPLPDRTVELSRRTTSGTVPSNEHLRRAPVSDAQGRFIVELAPGTWDLTVELTDAEAAALQHERRLERPPRKRTLGVQVAPGESADVRLALGGAPVRLHGRVALAEQVSLHSVFAWDTYAGTGQHRATIDGDHYEVTVPFPGLYTLLVYTDGPTCQEIVDVPAGEQHRFDVSIPVGRLAGRVTDERGAALAGVTVDAMSEGDEGGATDSGRAETDARGEYVLTLSPGEYRIFARVDFEEERAFLDGEERIETVRESARRDGIDFVLQRCGAIEGVVLGQDGLPASNVLVDVSGDLEGGQEIDEGGRFRITLPAGEFWVMARVNVGMEPGLRFARTGQLHVQLAEREVRALELRLLTCGSVFVRTTNAAGAPLATSLELLDARGFAWQSEPSWESDRHSISLPAPGVYLFRTRVRERILERSFELTADVPQVEIEWRLE